MLAFKYLTLHFYFSKQNFVNRFSHFHGKNVDKRLKVNYQAGCVCLRRIVLGSGLSSIFRDVFFNLLKHIEFIMPFASSYAGTERIFSLSKQAGAELYIQRVL